jgi:hypothetical protein
MHGISLWRIAIFAALTALGLPAGVAVLMFAGGLATL